MLLHVDPVDRDRDVHLVQDLQTKRALLQGGEQHLVGLLDLLGDLRHLHLGCLHVLSEELGQEIFLLVRAQPDWSCGVLGRCGAAAHVGEVDAPEAGHAGEARGL